MTTKEINQLIDSDLSFAEKLGKDDRDEMVTLLQNVYEQGVEDGIEMPPHEPDYNPQDDDRRAFEKEQRLNRGVNLFTNPITL